MEDVEHTTPPIRRAVAKQPSQRRKAVRRVQQRSIDTRQAILDAALIEFAERGFDGASTRRIGERAELDYTLIKYHYRTKDVLWKSTAEYAFEQLYVVWNNLIAADTPVSAGEQLRVAFRAVLRFTIEHPAFTHFMLRENQAASPRLPWLATNILSRSRENVMPLISEAQAGGELIAGDPDQIYYMLIGMTSALSSFNPEMMELTGFSLTDEVAIEAYWNLIERAIFR